MKVGIVGCGVISSGIIESEALELRAKPEALLLATE